MENIFVEFLPPWVETGLQPAFYDKESGTVLQQTARMYARVNMLIRMFNKLSKNTKETVEDFINQFNELHDYVHDYFDNLDVQEEINNKLDAMAESGALSDLIAQYIGLGALVVYDTLDDLISSVNITNGCKVKTLGKDTKGDGYGAYYTIGNTGDIALDNGLYATLVPNFGGNNYYDEITVQQIRKYDTDCYVFTIPVNDNEGNVIEPHVEYGNNISPLNHADQTFSTLTLNASLTIKAPAGSGITSAIPNIIGDGEALRTNDDFVNSTLADNYMYLGFRPDRSIHEFKVNNTSLSNLLASGCTQVFDVYYKLVEHGQACDLSNVVTNESGVVTNANPRQCLGVMVDGTIIILTCDGRTGNDAGLTSAETQDILLELGCYDAWNLDGGGSTSSVFKGSKVNRNIDNNRTTERNIPYTLNFRKTVIDEELAKAYSNIGREKQNTLEQVYESVVQNATTDISHQDLDDLTGKVMFAYGNSVDNRPIPHNGYFINIPHSQATYRNLYSKQTYTSRDTGAEYTRYLVNGTFTGWKPTALINRRDTNSPQTIANTHEYTIVDFNTGGTSVTNDVSNIITFNNDGTFSVTGNAGVLNVRVYLSVQGSIAQKYVEFAKNGTRVTANLNRFNNISTDENLYTFEYCIKLDSNSLATDKYSIRYYGNASDVLNRRQLVVEIK